MFLGRDAERRRIGRLWPRSRLIVLVGPGGMGKTALLRRLVEDFGSDAPAWEHVCRTGGDILDGLDAALDLSPSVASVEARSARLANALDRTSGVLCVEDVHVLSADEQRTLLRVASLLRTGHMVVTSRRTIRNLDATAVVVELRPLSQADATTLIADLLERLDRQSDASYASGLARASAGSPLWCRLLAAGASSTAHFRSVLAQLSPEALHLLERLSVFDEPVLASWIEPTSNAAAQLEERFLADRVEDTAWTVHDVVRQAVLSRHTPESLAKLHLFCAGTYAQFGHHEGRIRHLRAAGNAEALLSALSDGGAAWLWANRRVGELVRLFEDLEEQGLTLPAALELRKAACLAVQGRPTEARDCFERLEASVADEIQRALVESEILRAEGAQESERERFYERVWSIRDRLMESSEGARLVVQCVSDRFAQGHLRDASRRAVELCRSKALRDPFARAHATNLLAFCLTDLGETEQARRALEDAEKLAGSVDNLPLRFQTQLQWIDFLVRFGDRKKAEHYLQEAEAWPLPMGFPALSIMLACYRADVWVRSGRIDRALAALEACAQAEARAPVRHRLFLASLQAWHAALAGDVSSARSAARQFFSEPSHGGLRTTRVQAWIALALVELSAGRLVRAERLARVAAEAATRIGLRDGACHAVLTRAEVAVARERFADAREMVLIAQKEADAMGSPPLRMRSRLVGSHVELAAGAFRIAFDHADEALRLSEGDGNAFFAARAGLAMTFCALAQGQLETAKSQMAAASKWARLCQAPIAKRELRLAGLLIRCRKGSRRAQRELADLLRALAETAPGLLKMPALLFGAGSGALADPARSRAADLWMDLSTRRVIVDGTRQIDLRRSPILSVLLATLMQNPARPFPKEELFRLVWRGHYHPLSRDPVIYKTVERLRAMLDPRQPHRFLWWDEEGRLGLTAKQPCLIETRATSGLNRRQKWLLEALQHRVTISSREYQASQGISRATAIRDLEELLDRQIIRRERRGRQVGYARAM